MLGAGIKNLVGDDQPAISREACRRLQPSLARDRIPEQFGGSGPERLQ
jgi:hypothetical protein